MPREKGKECNHVRFIELKDKRAHQHKVECKYCKHVFVAGASHIMEHFLHINLACGVAKCTADEAVLQPVLDEMRASMLRKRQQQEQQQRSASSTEVQQQMRAELEQLYLCTQRQPEPLDHIARMQAGVAIQQPALG